MNPKTRDEITDILTETPWLWYCYISLPYGCDCPTAIKLIKKWQDTLFATETIQIGCAGIFDPIPHPHIHMLAIGSSERKAMLLDEDIPLAEYRWVSLMKELIFIKTIHCDEHLKKLFEYILLQGNPSGLSVPISCDLKGQLEGEGPYDEELFGPLDTDDGDKYEERVEELRDFVNGIWAQVDERKSKQIVL